MLSCPGPQPLVNPGSPALGPALGLDALAKPGAPGSPSELWRAGLGNGHQSRAPGPRGWQDRVWVWEPSVPASSHGLDWLTGVQRREAMP